MCSTHDPHFLQRLALYTLAGAQQAPLQYSSAWRYHWAIMQECARKDFALKACPNMFTFVSEFLCHGLFGDCVY